MDIHKLVLIALAGGAFFAWMPTSYLAALMNAALKQKGRTANRWTGAAMGLASAVYVIVLAVGMWKFLAPPMPELELNMTYLRTLAGSYFVFSGIFGALMAYAVKGTRTPID